MKKQYVFTNEEYCAVRTNVFSVYHYIARRLAENYSDDDAKVYGDLKYALDILDGYIELKDGM